MNAPVRFQMHTSPLNLLNLAESCTDYNHDGSGVLNFEPQPYRDERYWEEENARFAAFGHAASRHMISVASLLHPLGESAFFFHHMPFIAGVAGFAPGRDEMIFERTTPSCYRREMSAAFVVRSCGGGRRASRKREAFRTLGRGVRGGGRIAAQLGPAHARQWQISAMILGNEMRTGV
jgi:hypothetical protein